MVRSVAGLLRRAALWAAWIALAQAPMGGWGQTASSPSPGGSTVVIREASAPGSPTTGEPSQDTGSASPAASPQGSSPAPAAAPTGTAGSPVPTPAPPLGSAPSGPTTSSPPTAANSEPAEPAADPGPGSQGTPSPAGPSASSAPAPAQEAAAGANPPGSAGPTSPEETPAGVSPPQPPGQQSLQPVPDPQSSGVLDVQPASFNGVTPGITTLEEIQKQWGAALEVSKRDAMVVHLYRVAPFDHVEVSLFLDKVQSIVIRLQRTFPAEHVAKQLELANLRPVLVSNDLGEILGQSYPERGVLFGFQPADGPGKASMLVSQIILEPITAEPFVLRAETRLETDLDASAADLKQAVALDPSNARAHWLRARALAAMGEPSAALAAAGEAVRLEPANAQYRITRAQLLGQSGQAAEAIEEAQRALPDCDKRPHLKARALCLLGDLVGTGTRPDYKQAMQYHGEAIKLADPLASDPHPAIRLAAKEVLLDAHLGAAHDVAWGSWSQKEAAVPRWLSRAAEVADNLVQKEAASPEFRFRVAVRALAAGVGVRGQIDPTSWADDALRLGQQAIDAARSPARKRQAQWDLGVALYDAVQICQMRGEHDAALRYGEKAVAYLEEGAALKQNNPADLYLLARLYFRLGAIQAIGKRDHRAAVAWFDKAIPIFESTAERIPPNEAGRLGETFVSMGVSYWEQEHRQRALKLTERGVQLMESAARNGTLERSALEVPYSNLATMHRHLGNATTADKYLQEASRAKGTVQR